MSTMRWENVPVDVKVGTWRQPRLLKCAGCGLCSTQEPSVIERGNGYVGCNDCWLKASRKAELDLAVAAGRLVVERVVPPMPVEMTQQALDDLRQQLADARAERDRYIARCRQLEIRLERVREAAQ